MTLSESALFVNTFRAIALVVVASSCLMISACTSNSRGAYDAAGQAARNPEKARRLNAEASKVADSNPSHAERLLREALAADLYNGPAHNNLGILLLQKEQLYEAAEEFEWARKLMPGHPDPRVNLALTLEKAGMIDRALETYTAALDVYDNYLPALQGRSMLQIVSGKTDESTLPALDQIGLRGSPEWREWALLWKSKLTEH